MGCGTVAMVHAIANNSSQFDLLKDSVLANYVEKFRNSDPEEKGKQLGNSSEIYDVHKDVAHEGQTAAPAANEKVVEHFVALVHHDGGLWELDGRNSCPIKHGVTSPETLLQDAAVVCKKFMERDPDNH